MTNNVSPLSTTPNRGTPPPGGLNYDLRVRGMDCPSRAQIISRAAVKVPGVQEVSPDIVGGRVRVGYQQEAVSWEQVADAIRRIVYRVYDQYTQRNSFIVEGMDCAGSQSSEAC